MFDDICKLLCQLFNCYSLNEYVLLLSMNHLIILKIDYLVID